MIPFDLSVFKSQFLYKNQHLIWRRKSKYKFLLKNRYTYSFVFIFRYYCCFCCHVHSGWAVLISCPDLLFVLKERLPFRKNFTLTINLVFRSVCMLFFIKFFEDFIVREKKLLKLIKSIIYTKKCRFFAMFLVKKYKISIFSRFHAFFKF